MNAQKVGDAIAYLRKKVGFTQKDLADRIGISDKAVSKWERGISLPDVVYLRKLAILLNTDTDSLLAGVPSQHVHNWRGILIISENAYKIGASTIIYDKPLVYFLLSYFILVGIRIIDIVCTEADREYLEEILSKGETLGISLRYFLSKGDVNLADNCENVMLVYGRCLLYGVDQTRFFQRAMADKKHLTVLSLAKKSDHKSMRIFMDSNKKVINKATDEPLKTQYDYCTLPILFCPQELLSGVLSSSDITSYVSEYASKDEMFVELLDRGFVEIEIDDWEDVQEASAFIHIVQNQCGMNVYCIEEVAWRRGFISLEQFRLCGLKQSQTEYGQYILNVYDRFKEEAKTKK